MIRKYCPFVRVATTGILLLCLLAQTSSFIINCYMGNEVSVKDINFPKSSDHVCQANTTNNEYCIQTRLANWSTTQQGMKVLFGCGSCNRSASKASGFDCRECQSNYCNKDYVRDLLRKIRSDNIKLCYVSVADDVKLYPEKLYCPPGESCVTGKDSAVPLSPIVGCQSYCKTKNLTNCVYCNEDLCNNESKGVTFDELNHFKGTKSPATVIASDVTAKVGTPRTQPMYLLAVFAQTVLVAVSVFQLRLG